MPARIAKTRRGRLRVCAPPAGQSRRRAACAARRAGRHATAADDGRMKRATSAALFLLAAPAAGAWVPCEQKGITPPQPIQREAPAYPQAVRELGIEGSVEVALTVLRDGSVGWVRIVRAEPRGYFEQAAAEGVRRWRFSPAMQDGQADRVPPAHARALRAHRCGRDRGRPLRRRPAAADLSAGAPAGARRRLRRGRVRPRRRRRGQERATSRRDAARRVREGGARGRARLARARERSGACATKRDASTSACPTPASTSCRRRCSRARPSRWPPASGT